MSKVQTDPLLLEKKESSKLFDRIHSRYDLLNHLLTFRLDLLWRKKVAKLVARRFPAVTAPEVLDLAAGTGDMALAVRKQIRTAGITIADPSEKMLNLAMHKLLKRDCCVRMSVEDAAGLSFRDASFDCITIAFGVRNFPDLEESLAECRRVLRPGGAMFILEFGWPRNLLVSSLYWVYSATVIPLFGWLVARDREAYGYLTRTIRTFPYGNDFTGRLQQAGFSRCTFETYSGGIVYLYQASVPPVNVSG